MRVDKVVLQKKKWDIQRIKRAWFRGRKRCGLLSLISLPLFAGGIKAAINSNVQDIVLALLLGGMYLAALYVLRQGLDAEHAYNLREVAAPPKIPRKAIAAVLMGCVTALMCFMGWQVDLISAGVFGAIVGSVQYVAFGPDPQTSKGAPMDTFIYTATHRLNHIEHLGQQLRSHDLTRRLTHVVMQSRSLVTHVQDTPDDRKEVQKLFNVYLPSTQDALEKFLKLEPTVQESEKLANMLNDLDQSIVHYRQKLTNREQMAFDIELEVLSDRLKAYH